MTLLRTITYPKFLTHVKLADKAAPKYYKKGVQLPKKYQDTEKYVFCKKTDKLIRRSTGQFVIKNSATVGKPRYKKINGQEIYSGNMHHAVRTKMVNAIKDDARPYVKNVMPVTDGPFRLEIDMYDELGKGDWDLDNRWVYTKCLQDLLVKEKILPEDNVLCISSSPGFKFTPVDSAENRKIVLRIYKDERPELLENEQYAELYSDSQEW